MIKHFQQIDFSSLTFEKIKVSADESVILPRFDSGDCHYFQLPWVQLDYFGIPQKSKYFPTDKERTFIQIPIQGELLEKFRELDEYIKTKMSETPPFDKYVYQPIVKEAMKGEFIKVKLQTNYETGNIETIMLKDGAIIEGTENLPGFEQHIKRKSNIKAIIKLSSFWVMNKKYGASFKLMRIAVDDPKQETINLDALDFID